MRSVSLSTLSNKGMLPTNPEQLCLTDHQRKSLPRPEYDYFVARRRSTVPYKNKPEETMLSATWGRASICNHVETQICEACVPPPNSQEVGRPAGRNLSRILLSTCISAVTSDGLCFFQLTMVCFARLCDQPPCWRTSSVHGDHSL